MWKGFEMFKLQARLVEKLKPSKNIWKMETETSNSD